MYLVLGSDCKIAKLHPLGSVLTLTALWAKVSFSSRILSYTLFISEIQHISDEELWRFDKISAKKKKTCINQGFIETIKWFRSKWKRKTIRRIWTYLLNVLSPFEELYLLFSTQFTVSYTLVVYTGNFGWSIMHDFISFNKHILHIATKVIFLKSKSSIMLAFKIP